MIPPAFEEAALRCSARWGWCAGLCTQQGAKTVGTMHPTLHGVLSS